jgi:hypothetical protein
LNLSECQRKPSQQRYISWKRDRNAYFLHSAALALVVGNVYDAERSLSEFVVQRQVFQCDQRYLQEELLNARAKAVNLNSYLYVHEGGVWHDAGDGHGRVLQRADHLTARARSR